ncbi:MAG: ATP-binding protein [Bryobacteraceae bacterium]
MFMAAVVFWVVAVAVFWNVGHHAFVWSKALVLGSVVLVAAGISRLTMRLLTRPLVLLQAGITSVREGRFEPIRVSRTGDEIEYLGESFNRMIEELAASREEIRQHQDLLEERIRQRTQDLEKAMHTALAASQAKSEFLANMSHELRTPMNGMLGMIEVVLDSSLNAEQRENLETSQRCAFSLLALLNDILDLSKIESGKMLLEKIPFDIRSVLQDCVKSYAAKARQKKIDLRFESDPRDRYEIVGDPLRVRQMAANLISNGLKFTERGSVLVRLWATPAADERTVDVRIQVSDTGTGIPAGKLRQIFDKFTQADGSITRKYGGSGLGLAITRSLAEMHGGEVRVESEPGKGSTFTVILPCEAAPFKAAAAREVEGHELGKPASPVSSATLLLVEDNLVNQKVVLAILKKKGYRIEIANHGGEALDKMEDPGADYALILMDVQMPVLDGLEATRVIRQNPRWGNIPIVAMTAHAMNGDRERCLRAGMNAYISKPVQPAHLVATIESLLAAREGDPALQLGARVSRAAERMMSDDSGLIRGMLELFVQIAPERLEKLQSAAGGADARTLEQEARMIAAAADRLGSPALGECARRIEEGAATGDFERVKLDLQMLKGEIQSLAAMTT